MEQLATGRCVGLCFALRFRGSAVESDYVIQVMVLAAVYAAVGTAWSIAGGLSGLLLLGYISFSGWVLTWMVYFSPSWD